jgi:mRNA interferase MazF
MKKEYPTNVFISKEDSVLNIDSTVLLNQIRTVDKRRIIKKLGSLNSFLMNNIDRAIKICLALD